MISKMYIYESLQLAFYFYFTDGVQSDSLFERRYWKKEDLEFIADIAFK